MDVFAQFFSIIVPVAVNGVASVAEAAIVEPLLNKLREYARLHLRRYSKIRRFIETVQPGEKVDSKEKQLLNTLLVQIGEQQLQEWLNEVRSSSNTEGGSVSTEGGSFINTGSFINGSVTVNSSLQPPSLPSAQELLKKLQGNSKKAFNTYVDRYKIFIDQNLIPTLTVGSETIDDFAKYIKDVSVGGSQILLFGEGGIGKSYVLLDCCARLIDDPDLWLVYVPLRDLRGELLLDYVYMNYFSGIDCRSDPVAISQVITTALSTDGARAILIADGLNELAAMSNQEQYSSALTEIKWLLDQGNFSAVISSRTKRGLSLSGLTFSKQVETKGLSREKVINYLQCNHNTNDIKGEDIDTKTMELLQIPLLLSLFAQTYSAAYTELNEPDHLNRLKKHSDILNLCIKYQERRLGNSPASYSDLELSLTVLLPTVSLNAGLNGSNKLSQVTLGFPPASLLSLTVNEIRLLLSSEAYRKFWALNGTEFQESRRKINDTIREINDTVGSPFEPAAEHTAEYNLFMEFINPLLTDAVFLEVIPADDGTIVWRHELYMEWFIAKGIVFSLPYQPEEMKTIITNIARDVYEGKIADVSQDQDEAGIDALIPIALYVCELLEDEKNTKYDEVYVRLLGALSRAYSQMKDIKNTCKFAIPALDKICEGCLDGIIPTWRRADMINHLAYDIQTSTNKTMNGVDIKGKSYNYAQCLEFARQYYDQALSLIEGLPDNERNQAEAIVAEAQLYGNLGANNLGLYAQSNYKDEEFIHEAIRYHERGLATRKQVYGDPPDTSDGYEKLALSYDCLATDYYYLGKNAPVLLKTSLENHHLAIKYREAGNNVQDSFKFRSYLNCIGVLTELLANGVGEKNGYLSESIDLFNKAIPCLENPRTINKNFVDIRDKCDTMIDFAEKNRSGALDDANIKQLKELASKIKEKCDARFIE